jgi:hypothetical protein
MADRYELRGVRIGAVIAIAAVIAFLVWFFAIRDTGSDSSSGGGGNATANRLGPEAASESDLAALSQKLDQPIYWAGNQPGTSAMELTQTADGNVYVRYLTGNAGIGTPKPSYLTIGTYPFTDAFHALQVIAKRPGAVVKDVSGGGLAVTNADSPTSVYLAYPNQDFQVEVYDPDPSKGLDLVTSGDVRTVR